jgi:hypothetical protein
VTTLTARVEIGTGEDAVVLGLMEVSGGDCAVEVVPLRAPFRRQMADGSVALIYGPGADQRVVTVSGTGRRAPDLSGLDLDPVELRVYWPDGTFTVLSVRTAGIEQRRTALSVGTTGWTLVGVGTVTSGVEV